MLRMMNERFDISKLHDYNMVLHCTNAELYARVESMFLPGMSWSNYGTEEGQWTVKYIIPLYHFHDYGIPLTVHTTTGPVHITMEDMCTCVNVHPAWSNQEDKTPTHDEVIKKCIEISQYLSKKQIESSGLSRVNSYNSINSNSSSSNSVVSASNLYKVSEQHAQTSSKKQNNFHKFYKMCWEKRSSSEFQ